MLYCQNMTSNENEMMPIESKKQVDLGFAEECDPLLLRNVYFPSKVGGKPAWLDLDEIPSTEELKCNKCGFPKSFLCQIYAPIEGKPECFHRTIFLFVCRESSCFAPNSSENISAFRSQLPRQNKFYSAVPPNDDEELDPIKPSCKLCTVCGCRGAFMCSRCKSDNYCSAKHQRAHWPHHKIACKSGKPSSQKDINVLSVNFPEFEIEIEQEIVGSNDSDRSDDEAAEQLRLEEYQKLVDQGKTGTMQDIPDSELNKYATEEHEKTDECFRNFKKRTSANPSQILRYDPAGEPLWITDAQKSLGSLTIPPCERCNSERQFEFQIMPQMINYLKDDNIDWGVLAVYTCKNNCEGTGGYAREFIVKQDIISEENK